MNSNQQRPVVARQPYHIICQRFERTALGLMLLSSLVGCVLGFSCATATAPLSPRSPTCPAPFEAGGLFDDAGVEGVFVLYDEAHGCTISSDDALANQPFSPKSTFKIPNALIGLETGVIEEDRHAFRWDGSPRAFKEWEQDLDLGGALRFSCVPCFQEVARGIGQERMQEYLSDFSYGNQAITGPLDQFWLDGPMRITPLQQVDFVRRMVTGKLPVKSTNVSRVWSSLAIEHGPDFAWYGKTGLGPFEGRAIGWLVGYVERRGHRWFYATLVRGRAGADVNVEMARLIPLRKSITRALLKQARLLPEE
jgi:beta-lactamase class D